MKDWLRTLHDELQARGAPVARVVVATVRGSAPRGPGACMIVTSAGQLGTIGGGHLEFVATRSARDLLAGPPGDARLDRFSLGASLGQCCGGIVELWFQRYDASYLAFLGGALRARDSGEAAVMASRASGTRPRLLSRDDAAREGAALDADGEDAVLLRQAQGATLYERILPRATRLWLFGAGHVAKALMHVLAPLPFAITWVDSRAGAFPGALPAGVRAIESADPAEELRDMRRGDWALVMTHSHDEDFALCRALLERGDFGWAGVIGSLPKATRFRQRLLRRGFSPRQVARLVMPIGIGGIRSKEAAAIAVAVAAQLLQLRETHASSALAADEGPVTIAARES